jgi:ribosomal-protein-alanine N-acetyltransferase
LLLHRFHVATMDIPRLYSTRLIFRGFTPTDLEPLHKFLLDRDVIRYFPRTEPWSIETVQRWMDSQQNQWDDHGYGWWALELRENHKLIGWCGLGFLDETEETEVLYLLGKPYWGRGLATESAKFSINYAFKITNLDMIIGLNHVDNYASQRVLEKTGLSFSTRAQYFGLEVNKYTVSRDQFVTNK